MSRFSEHPANGTIPSYTFVFPFERDLDIYSVEKWWPQVWPYSIYLSTLSLIFAYFGQYYMATRPPFKLKTMRVAWNAILAIFSIAGLCRTLPEMLHVLQNFGFKHSVCSNSYMEVKPFTYWGHLWIVSKLPEMVDMIFIILCKHKFAFFHCWHHVTVLLYTWYVYMDFIAPARWTITMNYFIHSLLYTAWFLKSVGVRVPEQLAFVVVPLAMSQMVLGSLAYLYAYQLKLEGYPCQITREITFLTTALYASYFILFAHSLYRLALDQKHEVKSAGVGICKIGQNNDKVAQKSELKQD